MGRFQLVSEQQVAAADVRPHVLEFHKVTFNIYVFVGW